MKLKKKIKNQNTKNLRVREVQAFKKPFFCSAWTGAMEGFEQRSDKF